SRRNGEDAGHLEEVRERSWILKGMRAVGVEEAAAVRAELLDDFLRGDRSLRDRLLRAFNGRNNVVRPKVLDDTLRHEHQRTNETDREKDPETAPDDVDPEIAERVHFALRDTADERDRERDADGGRSKVVKGEAGHL